MLEPLPGKPRNPPAQLEQEPGGPGASQQGREDPAEALPVRSAPPRVPQPRPPPVPSPSPPRRTVPHSRWHLAAAGSARRRSARDAASSSSWSKLARDSTLPLGQGETGLPALQPHLQGLQRHGTVVLHQSAQASRPPRASEAAEQLGFLGGEFLLREEAVLHELFEALKGGEHVGGWLADGGFGSGRNGCRRRGL